MEFKEKLNELQKCIEKKLSDFEKDTGTTISYIKRDKEEGFKVNIRL